MKRLGDEGEGFVRVEDRAWRCRRCGGMVMDEDAVGRQMSGRDPDAPVKKAAKRSKRR